MGMDCPFVKFNMFNDVGPLFSFVFSLNLCMQAEEIEKQTHLQWAMVVGSENEKQRKQQTDRRRDEAKENVRLFDQNCAAQQKKKKRNEIEKKRAFINIIHSIFLFKMILSAILLMFGL